MREDRRGKGTGRGSGHGQKLDVKEGAAVSACNAQTTADITEVQRIRNVLVALEALDALEESVVRK